MKSKSPWIRRSATEKNIQPVKLLPAIRIQPSKEQIQADRKLIEEYIAKHGVKVCPPAHFVPRDHDFNRIAKPASR